MSITIILSILFIHWIADFVCQTDKMAQGKSKNWVDLLSHTGLYSIIFMVPITLCWPNGYSVNWYVIHSILFVSVTFICHTIQDYFTSRLNSKLWNEKKVHWFFVSIGFDQWLHFVQLILTYKLLIE